MSMRMAEAVMLDGDVFQQPMMPAVKETNMKKKPTRKRAIMARIISRKLVKIFLLLLSSNYYSTHVSWSSAPG